MKNIMFMSIVIPVAVWFLSAIFVLIHAAVYANPKDSRKLGRRSMIPIWNTIIVLQVIFKRPVLALSRYTKMRRQRKAQKKTLTKKALTK